jgi:soluble lytic murein transglycosylase-like protein
MAVRNLGIQMFDVVPQLASGASVMTTLVQQGGQVAQMAAVSGTSLGQLAKGAAAAVLSINPIALAATAVTAGLVAVGTAAELSDRRIARMQNTLRATRSDYAEMAVAAEAAARAVAASSGISTADARSSATAFAAQPGFNGSQDQLESLVRTADDLATRLGIDVAEATAKMVAGMRSASGLAKDLEGKLQGFDSELTRTVGLQEQAGKGAEAFGVVLGKLKAATAGAADEALTPLGKATQDLGNAFTKVGADGKSLAESLGTFVTDAAAAAVKGLANVVAGIESLRQAAKAPAADRPADAPRRGTINGARLMVAQEGAAVFDSVAAQSTLPAEQLVFARKTMLAESSGKVDAVSSAGARGLMGLMPATAKGLGVDIADPVDNVRGGLTYIGQLWAKYGGDADLVAMAYNWGPGNLDKFLASARSLADIPAETRAHVTKVTGGDLATRFAAAPATLPTPPVPPTAGPGVTDAPDVVITRALERATGGPTATRETALADVAAFRDALALLAAQGETTGARVARLREALSAAAKTAGEAVPATTKLAQDIQAQAGAADKLTAAYGKGYAAVREVTAATQAEAAARGAVGRGAPEYAATVAALTAEYVALAEAQARTAVAARTLENVDALEMIQAESAALGMNSEARAVMLAALQAEQELKRQGIDVESDLGRAYTQSAEALASATAELDRHKRGLDALSALATSTADNIANAITNSFLSGTGAAVNWSNVARAALAQVGNAALKMGAINPVLNATIGGEHRTTLFDAIGGATGSSGSGGGLGGSLNIASTLGRASDALGLTDFAGKISSLGKLTGLTGDGGLLSGLGSKVTGLLNTPLWGASAGIEAATASQVAAATAPSGLLSEAAVAGNMGIPNAVGSAGTTIGGLASGIGLGYGVGSLAGGFVQSSMGKVGPAPQIGAGAGAIGGAIAGSFVPVIGPILGGLIGGALLGGGGGLIGPKKATPFSATGVTVDGSGSLGVGATASQIVDTSGEVSALAESIAQLNAIMSATGTRIANGVSRDNINQDRLIGAESGQWLNIGQGDGRPGDLGAAFRELRFTSDTADTAASLSGKSFGSAEELASTLAAVVGATTFLADTVPALTTVTESASTFATQLAAVNAQYAEAINYAKATADTGLASADVTAKLRQAETDLAAARDRALIQTVDRATEGLLDTAGATGALERQLRDLNRQYEAAAEAVREARESGDYTADVTARLTQAETDLATARGLAERNAVDAAGKALAAIDADLWVRHTNATLGRSANPADRVTAALYAADGAAERQRKELDATLTGIWGTAYRSTAEYADQMALLERTLQAERVAIVEDGNRDVLAAETAGRESAARNAARMVESLASYAAGLATGPLSALSAPDQYATARATFAETADKAATGDAAAVGALQRAADALLTTSRAVNGSGAGYAADFGAVMAALDAVAAVAPDTLTGSVFVLETRTATEAITAAIGDLQRATGAPVTVTPRAEAPAPAAYNAPVIPGALTESVFVRELRDAVAALTPAGALTESVFFR